jgi:hypothetical protein
MYKLNLGGDNMQRDKALEDAREHWHKKEGIANLV